MENLWKPIVWFEWFYEVSSLWEVKSIFFQNYNVKKYRDKILKQTKDNLWYLWVRIYKEKKQYTFRTHQLVAKAFIENTYNKRTVNHKNWIKTDNRLENLERATYSENHIHARRELWRTSYMKWMLWVKNIRSKKVIQKNDAWEIIKIRDSISDVNRAFWVISSWTMAKSIRNNSKYHWSYWEYTNW